ncbi:MAG: ATPase, T2SS/T4P/T4SS family [Phycisphaeraceae bacterium]
MQTAPAQSADHDESLTRRNAFDASLKYFLGPLAELFADDAVSEIIVNGPADVYVERNGQLKRADLRFRSARELLAAANNIAQYVGGTVDAARPILDGRLPDGSRVCIVLPPIVESGAAINIRRFRRAAVLPQFLLDAGAVTPAAIEFLLLAVRAHQNILVSGGTGSGKTTLLNVLSTAFGTNERIVVIEDTRELQVQQRHVVQMEARPADGDGRGRITVRDLFVTSLRMRPDRIIVGEVRREEAMDLIQAMTSGHRGCMATLHASTPSDACHRLETLVLMAGTGLPVAAIRRQIASAIDLIVQTSRLPDGRRMVTHITEVACNDQTHTYEISDLFSLADEGQDGAGQLVWRDRRPRFVADPHWRVLRKESGRPEFFAKD